MAAGNNTEVMAHLYEIFGEDIFIKDAEDNISIKEALHPEARAQIEQIKLGLLSDDKKEVAKAIYLAASLYQRLSIFLYNKLKTYQLTKKAAELGDTDILPPINQSHYLREC
jgi:hypothetical protein